MHMPQGSEETLPAPALRSSATFSNHRNPNNTWVVQKKIIIIIIGKKEKHSNLSEVTVADNFGLLWDSRDHRGRKLLIFLTKTLQSDSTALMCATRH